MKKPIENENSLEKRKQLMGLGTGSSKKSYYPQLRAKIEELEHEIEERKIAQDELSRLKNFLANVIQVMPSILIGVSTNFRITQWNALAVKETGIRKENAIGTELKETFPFFKDQIHWIQEAIDTDKQIEKNNFMVKKQGEKRFWNIIIFPIFENNSNEVIIRIDDITEQVRIREMMLHTEKMLSIGGLAAGMAHEINNPLAGIMQSLQVLKNRLTQTTKKNVREAHTCNIELDNLQKYLKKRDIDLIIDRILLAGSRAAEIVTNMLSFARKSEKNMVEADLCDLIEKTIELLGTDYRSTSGYDFRKIRIEKNYEGEISPVFCIPSKIQQVLLNIIKNGAEAITELSKMNHCLIKIHVFQKAEEVFITISDNGPGIPEKIINRIFDPFFTTKPTGKGTGLGLSVSYFIIVDEHHGSMQVKSFEGKGTSFEIRLPIMQGQND